MKNVLKHLALVAFCATAAVSCQKSEVVGSGNESDIFFTLNTGDTKTYMVAEGNNYQPMWAKGDEIGVLFEGFTKGLEKPQGTLANVNENGSTASFEGTIEDAPEEGTLYAFYPAKFVKTYTPPKEGDPSTIGFDIVAKQHPTATSFDPKADLLISKPVSYNAVGGEVSIDDVFFARALAMLKINVYSSDFAAVQGQYLSELTVTAVEDTLGGRPVFDLTKGNAKIIQYNTKNTTISALYEEETVKVGSLKTGENCSVFLIVAPVTLNKDAKLKFEGETSGYKFSKEVTLPSDIVLSPGKFTEINLSISESNCEKKVAETRLYVESFDKCETSKQQYQPSQTGALGVGVSENLAYEYSNNNCNIRFNNNGQSSSNPYLYVNSADQTAHSFTIKNLSVPEDMVLIFTAWLNNKGDLNIDYKASDAQEWNNAGTITISTETVKTRQSLIFPNEIKAGSVDIKLYSDGTNSIIVDDIVLEKFVDQRTTLAVPANVKAEADAATSNKVNVNWGTVENAGSYEITLSTDGEEDVVEDAETNSISFTGLKYSTKYSVKVKAISSDVTLYKDSEYSATVDVTTGAKPAVQIDWVKKAVADILPTDEVVLVGDNANTLNSTAASSNPALVAVTVSNGKLTSEVTDDMKWNLVGNTTDGFILYANGTTDRYLYCNTTAKSSSNTCIRVGSQSSNIRNLWTIDKDGYMITKDSYTMRYLSVYTDGPDWRGYTNTSNGAQKVEFYVKDDPRTALAMPEITVTPDNTAKKITVTWGAVDNAADYTVTCTGQTDQTVTGTSCEFTGLAYGNYTVTVQANPAAVSTTHKSSGKASKDVSLVDTTPTINASNPAAVEATATSVEVSYTVANKVDGTNLTAAVTSGDWISNPQVAADKVTFTLTANTTSVQRTGTVTLSYPGAESKVVTITQKGVGQNVYASLEDLVAAGEPKSGDEAETVTVTFSNKEITSIYVTSKGYRNGIFLPVNSKEKNEIEIYCYDVPVTWVEGGTVSGTLTNCEWKKYYDTWELCPSNWDDITYTAPLPKCETPVITLDGAKASITCATSGATILYEISATEPASFTKTYSSPVTLTDGQTIWAKATKSGNRDSDVVSRKYTAGGSSPVEATFGSDWNSVFGTSYSGTISSVKANSLTLEGTVDNASIKVTNGSSTSGYVKTSDFRAYNGYTITLTAPTGKNITAISSTKGGKNFSSGVSANVGTVSISNNTISWTGSSNSVVLSISGTVSFATITVTYE